MNRGGELAERVLGMTATGATLWTAIAMIAVAAWTDARRREIPHWATGGLLAVWGVAAALARPALGGTVAAALICGVIGLGLGVLFYAFGWLGGGDGKLLAVLGLWLGPRDVGFVLLAGAGLLLLFYVAAQRNAGGMRRRGIPFACAVAPPAAVLLATRAFDLNG